MIAPSTLIELRGGFPAESGYGEIARVHPSIGGEAAGSAYVLARLGVPVRLGGNRLGVDEASTRVMQVLAGAGIDCGPIALEEDVAPVVEVVVSAGTTRTVFGTYGQLLADRSWRAPREADVRSSRIVCLDPFFSDASTQVARWCVASGIPYVTVDVEPDGEIARNAAVLIISEEFASRVFEAVDPRDILASYVSEGRGLVILTRGGEELLYARSGGSPAAFAPFSANVRDTTGAGDSFRAGVIYAMLRGGDDEQLVRTGSAAAALVCERAPGVVNSPSAEELQAFLAGRHGAS